LLIDTHCHLNDQGKFASVDQEIEFARSQGVQRMIVVGIEPIEWSRTVDLAKAHPELFCILGWHPNHTADYSKDKLASLATLARTPKCLAIGEIGLDYHWDYASPTIQREALLDQLDLAQGLNLPVVFHAREAYSDLLDVLEARPPRPYLLHCFAGDAQDARRATALECYFGVDGPISYKKADELRDVIRSLPQDRLVVETDAPYLTPVPFRGKPNRPGYVKNVNAALAETLGLSDADCQELTTQNALRFFGSHLLD
jgi:TatD DNase family protein